MAKTTVKDKIKLSASKIKTLESCSWLYNAKYILRLPDTGNSGSARGTVAHLIFELLFNDRHKKYFNKLKTGKPGILKCTSIHRLILKHAKKLGINNEEDLDLTYEMIGVGLSHDFYCDGAHTVEAEDNFFIEQDDYIINGFIDKTAQHKDKIVIYDYKSSKKKFSKKEIDFNIQALIYILATFLKKKTIPSVKFLFLRFKEQIEQEAPEVNEEQLEGFQAYLSYIAGRLSDFSEKDAQAHMAKNSGDKKWLCGSDKEGKWCCSARMPRIFYIGVDDKDKFIMSSFEKDDLKKNKLVKKTKHIKYSGCPAWFRQVEDPMNF